MRNRAESSRGCLALLESQHVARPGRLRLNNVAAPVDRDHAKYRLIEAERALDILDGECEVREAERSNHGPSHASGRALAACLSASLDPLDFGDAAGAESRDPSVFRLEYHTPQGVRGQSGSDGEILSAGDVLV